MPRKKKDDAIPDKVEQEITSATKPIKQPKVKSETSSNVPKRLDKKVADKYIAALQPFKSQIIDSDKLIEILDIKKNKLDETTQLLVSNFPPIIKTYYYLEESEGAPLILIPPFYMINYFRSGYFYHPITRKITNIPNIRNMISLKVEILPDPSEKPCSVF